MPLTKSKNKIRTVNQFQKLLAEIIYSQHVRNHRRSLTAFKQRVTEFQPLSFYSLQTCLPKIRPRTTRFPTATTNPRNRNRGAITGRLTINSIDSAEVTPLILKSNFYCIQIISKISICIKYRFPITKVIKKNQEDFKRKVDDKLAISKNLLYFLIILVKLIHTETKKLLTAKKTLQMTPAFKI